ncbi:hypothetical protein IAD21_04018 [Abditibacteriota bacterium]|nr:hypothetical protein IAD21_04018 [Abditibacteriota bacterium]
MSFTPFLPRVHDVVPRFDATPFLPNNKAVGLRHFHAIDPARDDVSTEKRQFMVSVLYPASADGAAPQARLTDILAPRQEGALELLARESELGPAEKRVVFIRLQSLALRAQRDLKPTVEGKFPVLIYYPGGISHRLSNAALCEQLASLGYVVLALDAPRDAPVVAFPDGQLVPFLPDNDEDTIWPRVADVHFLLDQLEELNTIGPFSDRLDLTRIGMFGHSRGGYLSNICAVEDPRIRAAVNMDGFLWGLWTEGTGLDKYPVEFQERAHALKTPILRLRGAQVNTEVARRSFEEEVRDFGGDFISVALHGYQHGSFATMPWLNGVSTDFAENAMQAPPTPERVELLTALLNDFFATYLLNRRPQMKLLTQQPGGMDVFSRCCA